MTFKLIYVKILRQPPQKNWYTFYSWTFSEWVPQIDGSSIFRQICNESSKTDFYASFQVFVCECNRKTHTMISFSRISTWVGSNGNAGEKWMWFFVSDVNMRTVTLHYASYIYNFIRCSTTCTECMQNNALDTLSVYNKTIHAQRSLSPSGMISSDQ